MRVNALSVSPRRPTSRGSKPIATGANLRISSVTPPTPNASLYSDQPTRPSSVVTLRKESVRQPPSACRSSIEVMRIERRSLGLDVGDLRELSPLADFRDRHVREDLGIARQRLSAIARKVLAGFI